MPSGTHVTGTWTDPDPAAPLPPDVDAFIRDGAPPVVLTFGSMRGLPDHQLDVAVERLLGAGLRLMVQGPLIEGVESTNLHRLGALDHRALFPRAALVVHHGGAGTTHAVAAAGVPSVVIPHIGDQRYWADRLRRLGAAPRAMLAADLDGAALAETILAATGDRSLRDSARQLARSMAGEDGIAAAIGLLESVAP